MTFYKSTNLHSRTQRANSPKRALQLPGNSTAQYIKHLDFCTKALSDETNISSIVRYCPNLQSIRQATNDARYDYYPELLALRKQGGHLRYLEQVDGPFFDSNAEAANADYIQLMLASKKSITKLYLCNYSSNQPSAFTLTEHIAAFNHLKEVVITLETGITARQLYTMLDSKHSYQKIAVKPLLFAKDQHLAKGDACAGLCALPPNGSSYFELPTILSGRHSTNQAHAASIERAKSPYTKTAFYGSRTRSAGTIQADMGIPVSDQYLQH